MVGNVGAQLQNIANSIYAKCLHAACKAIELGVFIQFIPFQFIAVDFARCTFVMLSIAHGDALSQANSIFMQSYPAGC